MIESLELKAWIVLARAMDAISDRVKEDLRRHQLNSTEFGVLSVLNEEIPRCNKSGIRF